MLKFFGLKNTEELSIIFKERILVNYIISQNQLINEQNQK
jgi:hypothetical protein